jgi:polyhydroxyalkanoate synthesis regulator phasin
MALWSVPVYAKKKNYGYDVKKAYNDVINVHNVHGPHSAEYARMYNTFNQKYSEFLNDLDQSLKSKQSFRARKKMKDLVSSGSIPSDQKKQYTDTIGLDNTALEPVKKGLMKREETLETMKKIYEKMKISSNKINEKAQTLYKSSQNQSMLNLNPYLST